jgi:hypothetical protein
MPTRATATTTISWTTHGPRHRSRKLVEFIQKLMHNSAWWTAFLSQEAKAILINDNNDKGTTSFRRMCRVPK